MQVITYDYLSIPLKLQDLSCVLLDHEQLLLSDHLVLREELQLGSVLERAACTINTRPHLSSTLQDITSCSPTRERKKKINLTF